MLLNSRKEGSSIILTIQGDIIGENSGAEIVGEVNESLSESCKNCIVKLGDVRFMNSSGIGVLITLLTKISNQGGKFVLVEPSDQVNKLLAITKLNAVFNIANSEKEALRLID